MQDPQTTRSAASRRPLWLGIWFGGTVVLALILFALRLPLHQVIAFTLFGSSLGGLGLLTLNISNEDRKRNHED
jgi:hypothetical protein